MLNFRWFEPTSLKEQTSQTNICSLFLPVFGQQKRRRKEIMSCTIVIIYFSSLVLLFTLTFLSFKFRWPTEIKLTAAMLVIVGILLYLPVVHDYTKICISKTKNKVECKKT